jgi:hypothetical protein
MPTPVETILTSVGIPAEDVAKIISMPAEEAESFDVTPYSEKVKGNYQTQFKNDPSFFNDITFENLPQDVKKKLEGSQFARAANITRDKIKKGFGLTDADLVDLSPEEMEKLELFVPKVAEKWTKTKSSDKQVQAELIEARKQLEKFGPDYEEGIKSKYETQAEQKVTAAIFNANLISELSGIQGLKIAAGDIAKTANDVLQQKYAFEKVGDFSIELRQKANPQMKVLRQGSSQELTLKEALQEIAQERGWVEKEAGKEKGSGKVTIEPTKDGLFLPPHLQDKISQNIATEKAAGA